MMKFVFASIAIAFATLSVASAGGLPSGGNSQMPTVIGTTVGALLGATFGDGHGRTVATAAGGILGGVLGNSLSPGHPESAPTNSLVNELREQRNQVIEAAVTGDIPTQRKAVSARQQR